MLFAPALPTTLTLVKGADQQNESKNLLQLQSRAQVVTVVVRLPATAAEAYRTPEKLAQLGASLAESAANGTILLLFAARLPKALAVRIS